MLLRQPPPARSVLPRSIEALERRVLLDGAGDEYPDAGAWPEAQPISERSIPGRYVTAYGSFQRRAAVQNRARQSLRRIRLRTSCEEIASPNVVDLPIG